jgi:hypothetical protein
MNKILFVVMAAIALGACTEREQISEPQSEKRYQGKRDGKPWDNEPLAFSGSAAGSKWSKGDRASWETQIKARQLGQHEDKRIYQ